MNHSLCYSCLNSTRQVLPLQFQQPNERHTALKIILLSHGKAVDSFPLHSLIHIESYNRFCRSRTFLIEILCCWILFITESHNKTSSRPGLVPTNVIFSQQPVIPIDFFPETSTDNSKVWRQRPLSFYPS